MMKILHIVEDFSIQSGGLRTVINDLNNHLNKNNFESHILSSCCEKEDNIFLVKTKKTWLYSQELNTKMKYLNNKHKFDVIHIHGVWTYLQFFSAKFCIRNKIPFILSTHGMYEPWLWKKGNLKKRVYFYLLTLNLFKKAKFIHAITPSEKGNLQKLFKKNIIIEITNLINIDLTSNISKNKNTHRYLLYLGRLDEKKGIDILLKSFAKIQNFKIKLIIAGQFNEYKNYLDKLLSVLNIESNVEFFGLVKGEKKIQLISNAFILIAPSYSEVIGMVNLEGAILKTPVITTFQTGLNPLWNENGGRLINPNERELDVVLNEVLNWTDDERNENGNKLYEFVLQNYSWKNRFSDWQKLYKSCVDEY